MRKREIKMDKNCTITNNYYYNCCGGETAGNGNGNPVGTVISYMGTKVPKHYLACDGTVLNITDYPALSEQIKDEFGTVDYFGGDGTETFAVPDLRNEFLRGYHGDATDQLSGDVGRHQDATQVPIAFPYSNGQVYTFSVDFEKINSANGIMNEDRNLYNDSRVYKNIPLDGVTTTTSRGIYAYNVRTTNMAVLYCIKYE